MKPSPLRTILLLFPLLTIGIVNAQTKQYYVVIGAFAKESNAKKFSGFVHSRFFQATYEMNQARDLFYVYAIKTNDKAEAYNQVILLQKEEAFKDSWVFNGTLGSTSEPEAIVDPEPVQVKPEPIPVDTSSAVAIIEEPTPTEPFITEVTQPTEPEKPKRVVKGKLFKFNIQTPTGEPFVGNVHHVDLKRGRDIASYSSSDYSDVPKPSEEPMTIVCGIFGYKEIMQLVDYQNPSLTEGVTQDAESAWVVPFKLERLKKGDVSVMYDVSFFKDAVIMLPRSQEELDELVSMMNTNQAYKIKIHGHTNGNNKRKIIALGKTRNYFNVQGSDQKNGSAKELSKQRAEAVRNYLIEHGIDKSRMEIMAWGGLNMLVGEGSASAKLNDRIEIEILED